MAKRQTGLLKACLVVVLALLVMLAALSVPVMAEDSSAGDSSGTSSETSSGSVSGSSVPEPAAGGLTVTGYELENGNHPGQHFSGELYKGGSLTVVLNIYDNRPSVYGFPSIEALIPMARLNTSSFSFGSSSRVYVSNAARTSIEGKDWTYQLRIENLTYTGNGKTFRCDIFYEGSNTVPLTTYEFTINQLVEYVEPSSSSDSSSSTSAVVKGTGFVLKEASYGQPEITAGQPFTLNATMLATNGDNRVENVSLSVTPAKELSLRDGSSVVYVGTVAPGQSVPVSFNLLAPATIAEGSYAVAIDIKGVDGKTGADVSAQVSITVPVIQPERFEIFNTQLPTDITVGMADGMGMGSITLVNQGKGAVSNVSVDIVGPGLSTEDGKQYVGNVAGGEQKSTDFNILADTPGQIAAQVVVSYESARGEAKELRYDFTINVMEGMMEDPGMMPLPDPGMMEPGQTGMPVWGWVLIVLGAVLVVVIVLVVVLKRRKKKKAAALEDDYEDD